MTEPHAEPVPVVDEEGLTLFQADCLDVLRAADPECLDAVVTDPPYGLEFMGKEWDSFKTYSGGNPGMKPQGQTIEKDADGQVGSYGYRAKNPRCRKCGKFKFQRDVGRCRCEVPAWDTRTREGAFQFQAFCEDVFREVWRVLKPGGHVVAFGGTRTYHRLAAGIEDAGFEIRDSLHWIYGTGFPKSKNLPGGKGTALKPAHEPIVLARKPLAGTVEKTVELFGTGALNIDACRVEAEERPKIVSDRRSGNVTYGDGLQGSKADGTTDLGRWPPNVILGEDAADDLGDPSRFFYVPKPSRAERDLGCEDLPARGGGEATDREEGSKGLSSPRAGAGRTGGARNFHPTVKPVELMRYLVRLVVPPGGVVLDPFMGSGTTGVAARLEGRWFVGVERSPDYMPIAIRRIGAFGRLAA